MFLEAWVQDAGGLQCYLRRFDFSLFFVFGHTCQQTRLGEATCCILSNHPPTAICDRVSHGRRNPRLAISSFGPFGAGSISNHVAIFEIHAFSTISVPPPTQATSQGRLARSQFGRQDQGHNETLSPISPHSTDCFSQQKSPKNAYPLETRAYTTYERGSGPLTLIPE